jgi:hypothetical protein
MGSDQNATEILRRIERHDSDIFRAVRSARNHRRWNTGLVIVLGIMVAINFWRINVVGTDLLKDYELSLTNAKTLAVVQARQDLYRQQYLDYIKDMIAFMQQLQNENANPAAIQRRGLRVPKAPVPRPVPADEKISEQDLRRIPQTIPVATPTPITKVIVKTKRIKVRPTPGPFERLFKPKSTR